MSSCGGIDVVPGAQYMAIALSQHLSTFSGDVHLAIECLPRVYGLETESLVRWD